MARIFFQYVLIRKKYTFLRFHKSDCGKNTFRQIFSYSIYSFIIAVALKVLFFTDSIVIGSFISVKEVTFYAIPMTLMIYLEQIIYAAMSVLTPVISSNDAIGENSRNQNLYIIGSRYSLIISLPILFVLFTNGDSFITMWMGGEYGRKSMRVIMILSVGYAFYLSQIIANGILKGTSKHKIYAFILSIEALINLGLSIILSRFWGIEGVALGTTIPLVVTNLVAVPLYTCKVLKLNYFTYIIKTYGYLVTFSSVLYVIYSFESIKVYSYYQLVSYSFVILLLYLFFSFYAVIDQSNRLSLISMFKHHCQKRVRF